MVLEEEFVHEVMDQGKEGIKELEEIKNQLDEEMRELDDILDDIDSKTNERRRELDKKVQEEVSIIEKC